jgi:hypothetical protein
VIDDDDDDALPGYVIAHHWWPEGTLPDGKPRMRCVRCAVLKHWPAADATCVKVQMDTPALGETEPLHAGQHEGPYAVELPRTCQTCLRPFRRPKRWNKCRTCSPLCAVELRRTTNRLARRRQRA